MISQKALMAWINVIGGIAVLGSYAIELARHPGGGDRLWGATPRAIIPFYGAWMLAAAAGYLVFTYYLFFRIDAAAARTAGHFGFDLVNALYVAILLPSALWMSMTFRWLDQPSDALWLAIRTLLLVIGLASLAMACAVATLEPKPAGSLPSAATIGALAFTVQTLLLDAILWPRFFRGG